MFKYLLNLLFLMIRKVIQLAGKTSVISLPLPWVRKYNIEKGAELELIERGREIIIKTNKDLQIDRIVININDLDEQSIKWTLSALHKFGYDEIEVVSDKEEYFQVLILKLFLPLKKELLKTLFLEPCQTPIQHHLKLILIQLF